jgi:hypothetical protein
MKHLAKIPGIRLPAMLLALLLALLVPYGGAHAQEHPAFSPQELERTLAPIALYPDPLLSQILMAATYPLEVVEAARWSRSHANLAGEDAVRAAANESWDPSVKSLLAFPHVLARMDENLQWLQTLGDAFLGQEPQVMDTVQTLRRRAQAAGNLYSDERQRVIDSGSLLVVQPVNPQIIYVPYYDPRVVYGPWWWPQAAPVYWRQFPGYYAWPGLASGFFWGPSVRISVNYFFGGFDWHRRHVQVVQNNYYYGAAANPRTNAYNGNRPPGAWQHDPVHRRGVAYRGPVPVQPLAAASPAPESARHIDREDARRQDGQRAQAYPAASRNGDASRPVVPAVFQQDRQANTPPATRQVVTPPAPSSRQDEPRGDWRRGRIEQVREVPAQPAVIRVATAQENAGADPRAEWRDPSKRADRGDRSLQADSRQAESRPAAPRADAAPQAQKERGSAASHHASAPSTPQATRQSTPQSAPQTAPQPTPHAPPQGDSPGHPGRSHEAKSKQEPAASATGRQEAHR